jgi:2-methoxy-6-polyprenyl-1,4-benzoquinol methylase
VTEGEKRERVAGVFTSVAESYDRMNDLMSFGWHRVWKCVSSVSIPHPKLQSTQLTISHYRDHFVASLNPGFSPLTAGPDPRGPQHILDIAGGTGDIAFRMLHTAHVLNNNPSVRVTMSDINRAMLTVGKQRASALLASQQAALSFVEANAEDLTRTRPLQPLSDAEKATTKQAFFDPATATSSIPSNSVDLYTVAFGIRNFSNIPAALREARRVLKPGGVFACLEFSKADKHPLFNALYKEWSFRAIPLIGQLVAADRDSYQYLVESIERFPSQEEFRDMIVDAGFVVAGDGYEDLTGGVAAIHKGMKPRA